MATHREAAERGESLLEILLSIMIMGIAVTVILGGVGVAAKASTQDERQIHAQALLRSWGEHVQARTTDATYVPCATTATYGASSVWAYTSPPPVGLEALPAGATATVTQVRYWDGGTWAAPAGCDDPAPAEPGLQRLELTLTMPDGLYPGFSETYDVVLRRPCTTVAAC